MAAVTRGRTGLTVAIPLVVGFALGPALPDGLRGDVVPGSVEDEGTSVTASVNASTKTPVAGASAEAVADTVEGPSSATGVRYRLTGLGGSHGIGGDELHIFGGVEAGALYGRFGAMALAQVGGGAGRRSVLVGGGPAVEVVDLEVASLAVYGGLGWYQESLDPLDVTRDLTGPFGGVSVRIPLPVGAVGVGMSVWRGNLGGDGVVNEVGVTGRRLSVGFGL